MSKETPIAIEECEIHDEKENHTDINSNDLSTLDDTNWLNDKVGFYKLSPGILQLDVLAHFR